MGHGFFENHWAYFLFIPAILLVLTELYFRRKRAWLVLPRLVWLTLMIFLIADWSFTGSKEWSQPRAVYVFYDTSDSVMRVPARKEKLQKYLKEIKDWSEKNKQPLRLYSFDDQVRPGTFDLKAGGSNKTRIAPIAKLIDSEEATAIVISDGNWDDSVRLAIVSHTISLSDRDEKDIWIDHLQPVMTAFLKNRLSIPVDLGQRGFKGKSVNVELWRGDNKIATKQVELSQGLTHVEFPYFPEKMGEDVLSIRVPTQSSELSGINNFATLSVRTVRDKIRILHIGGKPDIDLKAWRLFLTRQPDVDLVSFYILRSLEDDPQARNDELSLIPFPYDELFTTELSKFDIVILQNFNFSLYFQPFYLVNLAAFVQNGGSLLMMGGDQSFQSYRFSPLANLLPFKFNGSGNLEQGSYKAHVTQKHPIVNDLKWAFEIPTWHSRHKILSSPEAQDLVEFKDGVPFLSIRQVGKGRVMAINTDESWRFQFQPYGPYIPMSRFARRVLQYLTFDPEMDAKKMISGEWHVGKYVKLALTNSERSNWTIEDLRTRKKVLSASNKKSLQFMIPEPGAYEVKASKFSDSFIFQTEEKPWQGEWKNLISNDEHLKHLAESSGGKFFHYEDRTDVFHEPLSGKQIIALQTTPWMRLSKWLSWGGLIAILGILCVDFFLRKKFRWDL